MRVPGATALAGVLLTIATILAWPGASAAAPSQASTDCVDIRRPKPSASYTYEHVESRGNTVRRTEVWEDVTATGSRVRTTLANGTVVQVNEHHVADDAVVLDRSTKRNANGDLVDSTMFRPGIVGDPGFRACAGHTWPIPSVTATYESSQHTASSSTPAGTLRIVGIKEAVTVPAGTFDTVHYIRTSQSTDDYWKSIDHGVVVKHVATLPGTVITDTLISIQ